MEETNPARVTRNMSTLAQHEEPRPALKKTASFADLTEPSAGVQSTRDYRNIKGASEEDLRSMLAALQAELNAFKAAFEAEHGRAPERSDLRPVRMKLALLLEGDARAARAH